MTAIQGHSGDNIADLALQDNVLLPDDLTQCIYHIGNVSEIYPITKSGLIPGGRSLKRDRQTVFFTAVNPMDDDQGMEEIRYDLDKPRIAPYKNTWRPHQNTACWCNLKVSQKKGLQFYQTRSHAIVLNNTLSAICIEKAVCMKTKQELYHKVYHSPMLPRVLLKPNSQSGQQDQLDQEARKSSDHQSASGSYGATRSGNVDFWIPGTPHSTVPQQDTNGRETVKQFSQQFESHPKKEFLSCRT